MAKVEFIFDFSSPNAYFVHKVLPEILSRTGAQLEIKPVLLGGLFKLTNNQAPWATYRNIKGKFEYEMLEVQRFIAKHGLTKFQLNPHFPVNTVTLIRAALVAREEGYLDAYVDAGLAAMWEDGLNMADDDVFARAMSDAGFDGTHLLERASESSIKQALYAETQAAMDRGAFGVPTFYVGDDMFFGKERLGQVEEALLRAV